MSDNSSSTGSSGSSTNSWTLLSPEEAAIENVGPVDDGTESLGDVPSLSEEVAGVSMEIRPGEVPVETVLSEEGHQVCQETSPEAGEGPVPSSPTRSSPLPPDPLVLSDFDLDSEAPVIHDIVTSSPSDNEHLGATPFVTNIDLGAPLDIPVTGPPPAEPEREPSPSPPTPEIPVPAEPEPELEMLADVGPLPEIPAVESPVLTADLEVSVTTETLTASEPPSHVDTVISPSPASSEPPSLVPESLVPESLVPESLVPESLVLESSLVPESLVPESLVPESLVPESLVPESLVPESLVPESLIRDSPLPETVGPTEAPEEPDVEKEDTELSEKVTLLEKEEAVFEQSSSLDFAKGDTNSDDDDDGLRRRNVPRSSTSDEEEEEEDVDFKLPENKEEQRWFSVNKCIVGALILLCLGSLFLSDDFDTSEVSDGEQNQDWLNGDPQDMKELLDKLAQENQQISQLETQLQSQKKELDSALKEAAAKGDGEGKDLEKENAKMKEELSSLPGLKEELETLRARVTELTQLTANQDVPVTSAPGPGGEHGESNQDAAEQERRRKDSREGGRLKEELQRQKVLLDESGKRLEGMKRDGGDRKGVRESLEKIQKRLSEQVEKLGKKKPWEAKRDGNRGKGNGRDHWKKEEKKEWRGEKDWKKEHSKEGGRRDKDERREKDWKSHKQNSHKEAWRTYQDEWERKKDERRTDREERRKEKPWRSAAKDTHSHNQQHQHQQHQPRQPHQHNHNDFWRHQEEKLTRNVHPRTGCSTVEDCANKEGLYPVELSEFEELLEGYLSKLEGSPPESKDELRKLAAKFFQDGVFLHDRVAFSDFAEDVADILEDMADSLEDEGQEDEESEALEEEMEEFEREALWKFAVTA